MKLTGTNMEAMKPQTIRQNTRLGVGTITLIAAGILAAAVTGPTAHASCGAISGMKQGEIRLPSLAGAVPRFADQDEATPDASPNDSVVGLWHVIYTADKALFGESLKEWHSDGTEFENVAHNPEIGNICFGVWKQVGVRKFRLHHIGWLFSDDGTLTGSFTFDETDTVAPSGMSYKGTFVFKTYDLKGAFTGVEVPGTAAASRITVN
jgi:hypothetical protein